MTSENQAWDPYAPADPATRVAEMDDARHRAAVAVISTARGESYEILRYQDIVNTARDVETFSNGGGPRHERRLPPLEYDPPEHRVYRDILQPFFLPQRMRQLEPQVREIAIRLLTPLLAEGGGDFAKNLSYPLPVLGLCAQLDIPDDDWAEIKQWSEGSLLNESESPQEREWAETCHQNILAYGRKLIDARIALPLPPDQDIISAMMQANATDKPLDRDFVAYTLRLFISAGHNSTTGGLGNALMHLASHPADQEYLRANPSEIPIAIEEILRVYSPIQEMPRWANSDAEVGGCPIPKGARVGLLWGSGNRDESAFPDAEQCILNRRPNRHLAFGSGIHMCLGAAMARMELRVTLEELLARTSSFEISGTIVHTPFRRFGVSSLPVKITSSPVYANHPTD